MQVASVSHPRRSTAATSSPRERVRQTGLLRRIFARKRPTLYQRCLAVHIAAAGQ